MAPLQAEVVINEILYRGGAGYPEKTGEEFIELYNPDSAPVEIGGWAFTAGVDYTFPANTTLAAGSYIVVAADPAAVAALYNTTGVFGPWNPATSLSNKGEKIELSKPGSTSGTWEVVDKVSYTSEGDWANRTFVSTVVGLDWLAPGNVASNTFTASTIDTLTTPIPHGFAVGNAVVFSSTGTLPAPLVAGTTYFVQSAATPTTFTVATERGGAVVDITNTGIGAHTLYGGAHSLELRNPALDNNQGQNWAPSTHPAGATPNAPNSVFSTNGAPIITKVKHFPAVPKSDQEVTVSCQLLDETAATDLTATLYWRVATLTNPAAFQSKPMTGDGSGKFSAQLGVQPNLAIVEFYVSASDGLNTRTWPAPTNQGQVANCQYQVDNSIDPVNDTFYRLVLTATENAAYNASANTSDQRFNATVVRSTGTDVEIRYRCGMRTRGNSSRSYTINSVAARPLRITIPADEPLDGATAYDLNVKSAYLQYLGNRMLQAAGLVAPECIPIEMRRNGVELTNSSTAATGTPDFGRWVRVEAINSEFIDAHYPHAAGGNLYKKVDDARYWRTVGWTVPKDPDGNIDHWTKENNSSQNDWSDLTHFFQVWQTAAAPHFPGAPAGDVAQSDGTRLSNEGAWNNTMFTPSEVASVAQVSDLQQWARFFAVHTIMEDVETKISNGTDDDYSAYFVPGADGFSRMQLLPHDFDTLLGHGETATAYNTRHIFDMTGSGETFRPLLPLMANNSIPVASEFRTLYLNAVRELYGTVFNADTTGNPNPAYYTFLDNHLAGWVPTATIASIKTFATQRQGYLLGLIGAGTTPIVPPAATASATFLSPPTGTLRISEILANNAGAHANGATFPDVIELFNSEATPRDLSGMSLSDDPALPARYVFPAGTTIAANGYLIVYADSVAAAPGLHTGFGLSQDGDQLRLYDTAANGQTLLDAIAFGPQPANFSIGRTGAAGDTWALCTPTVGAANLPVASLGAPGGLVINEWMGNPGFRFDEDFLEIYNPSIAPVAMGGMSLTDDFINDPKKTILPPLSFIAPGGYLTFLGVGASDATPGKALELPFKIASASGWLALIGVNGTIVDRVDIVSQPEGGSTARTTNGGIFTETRVLPVTIPTPGASNSTVPATVLALYDNLRITEINYGPQDNPDAEYLEFTNTGSATLNLAGVRITNGVEFVFPPCYLVPEGRVLVVRNAALVRSLYGNGANIIGEYTGRLDNAGEKIVVRGPAPYDAAIVAFKYDPAWYPTTNVGGFTLELRGAERSRSDDDKAANWQASTVAGGSPPIAAAPAITSALSQPGALTVTFNYQLVASNQPYYFDATSLPPGLSFDPVTALISGIPSQTGNYNVTLTAANGAGSDSRTLAIKITTNPTPVITSATSAATFVGDGFAYQITAANVPTSYGVTGLPPELNFDSQTGLINGAFTAAKTVNLQISATNDAGTATQALQISVSDSGPLASFTWDTVGASAFANSPFQATLRARDAQGRLVTNFNGTANLTSTGPGALLGKVVITEYNTGTPDYFEIQNVGNIPMNTTGWFVVCSNGTSLTSPHPAWPLPNSIAAGAVIYVEESSATYSTNINWTGTASQFLILCDNTGAVQDFVATGFTRAQLDTINLSLTVNSTPYTGIRIPAAAWLGNGVAAPASTAQSARTRIGVADNNSSADWENRFQSDSTSTPKANPGATNAPSGTSPGLTVPFVPPPVTPAVTPNVATFTNGVWTGNITVGQALNTVKLVAKDAANHTGESNTFNVVANSSPAGGTLTLSPSAYVLPGAAVVARLTNWSDPEGQGPLTYSIFVDNNPEPAPAAFSEANLTAPLVDGIHVLKGRIFDGLGASTLTNLNFTVDGTPPVVTLQGGSTVSVEVGANYVDSGATATDALSGNVTSTIAVAGTVNTAAIAEFQLTYTARDLAGNTGSATRTVKVVDTTSPVVALLGANPIALEAPATFIDPGATAQDAVWGTLGVTATGTVNGNQPGTYNVVYRATDGSGNIGTKARQVIISDLTPPVITLNGASPMTIEAGAGYTDPGATAVDSSVGTVAVSVSGTVNAAVPGDYTLTYSATDGRGNTATKNRTVHVVDTTPPTIGGTFSPLTIETGPNGKATLPNYTGQATTSDNVGVTAVTQLPAAGAAVSAGVTNVTVTATDAAGNQKSTTFAVTVLDATNPQISAPPGGFNPNVLATGEDATVALPNYAPQAVTSDNVGVTTTTQNPLPGTPMRAGQSSVVLTVKDEAGNSNTVSFPLTVLDGTKPDIAAPVAGFTPLEITTEANSTAALPDYTLQAVTSDNVSVTEVKQSPLPGDARSAGSTNVTLTAVDLAGNERSISFPVTVNDGTVPEISAPAGGFVPATLSTGLDGTVPLPNYVPQAVNQDNVAVTNITQAPAAGTGVMAGVSSVTLSAFDAAGNTNQVTFPVTVLDGTKPDIAPPAGGFLPASITTGEDGKVALPSYIAQVVKSDNVDVVSVTQEPAPDAARLAGTTTVTLRATDAAGNTRTTQFNLPVLDGTKPTIAAPASGFTPLDLVAGADGTIPLPDYTAQAVTTDNVGVTSVTQEPAAGTVRRFGVTNVTLTAHDAAGNTQATDFDVSVALTGPLLNALAGTNSPVPGAGEDPRIPADAKFSSVGLPALDDDRGVAFLGKWKSSSGPGMGIFAGEPLVLVVKVGEDAPGVAGAQFKTLQDPLIAPNGSLAFAATVKGQGIKSGNDFGVWMTRAGALVPVLREGLQTPGAPEGALLKAVSGLSLRNGELLALVRLAPARGLVTAANDTALLRVHESGAEMPWREGSFLDLHDSQPAAAIKSLELLLPAKGSPGQGRWQGDGAAIAKVTLSVKRVGIVQVMPDGTTARRLVVGDPATAIGASAYWQSLSLPAVEPSGRTAVVKAQLKAPSVPGVIPPVSKTNDSVLALDSGDGDGFAVFAREGETADGGGLYATFLDPLINDESRVAFIATLGGPGVTAKTKTALYWGNPEAPVLLARAGSAAPDVAGVPTAARWASFTSFALPNGPFGAPVFLAKLNGPGVNAKNNVGLWAVDSTGLLRQLLRTGDSVNGQPVVGIQALAGVTGSLGASRGFNESGAVVARVSLPRGAQAIVRIDLPKGLPAPEVVGE